MASSTVWILWQVIVILTYKLGYYTNPYISLDYNIELQYVCASFNNYVYYEVVEFEYSYFLYHYLSSIITLYISYLTMLLCPLYFDNCIC